MFNRVPEKVPEKVWEALVQSQVMFNRMPKRCRRRSAMGGRGAELQQGVQSQVRFNRVPEKVLEKVPDPEKAPGGFCAEPGQIQHVPEKVPAKVAEAKVRFI